MLLRFRLTNLNISSLINPKRSLQTRIRWRWCNNSSFKLSHALYQHQMSTVLTITCHLTWREEINKTCSYKDFLTTTEETTLETCSKTNAGAKVNASGPMVPSTKEIGPRMLDTVTVYSFCPMEWNSKVNGLMIASMARVD
jgi:hypothetical protein